MNSNELNVAQVATDSRLTAVMDWLSVISPSPVSTVRRLAGDASFRRYFRVLTTGTESFVLMDAPPQQESCDAFVAIARAFEQSALRFPRIFAADLRQGFLLLSDFGDRQLLSDITAENANALYQQAFEIILQLQRGVQIADYQLPCFDAALYWREFDLFLTWYLQHYRQQSITATKKNQLQEIYQQVIDMAAEQPQVFVHRDYHSRNLMICNDSTLGILDFQDAVWGPVTYDLVSLLRDCYIAWPEEQVSMWIRNFYAQWQRMHDFPTIGFLTFRRWFDWMGVQRHLKCVGIFSRLAYRDHKTSYLQFIPRVQQYLRSVCARYPELHVLCDYL